MIRSAALATALVLAIVPGPSPAQAPTDAWSYAAQTEFQDNVAWVYGTVTGAQSEFGVDCSGGTAMVYFADGLLHAGDTRQGRVALSVDGRDFSREGTFEPLGHVAWWRMDAGDGLLEALRAGRSVSVRGDVNDRFFTFGLRGSSAAIGQVLAACGGAGAGAPVAAADASGLGPAVPRARIEEACRGPFDADGAIAEVRIDGDDAPDFVLDWSRVTCANPAVGRGGGYCGMQMCTLDVYASSTWRPGSFPQPILALGWAVPGPGADHAFETTVPGGACPGGGPCTRHWNWTGGALDAVRTVAAQGVAAPSAPPQPPAPAAAPAPAAPAEPAAPAAAPAPEDADPLASAGIVPGRWTSIVPESAMGFAAALYMDRDGVSMTLACGPQLPGLALGVTAPALQVGVAGFGPGDDVHVRLDGESFRTRFHEDLASGGDPMHLAARWDGQELLLDLLAAGAPVDIVVHPGGRADAARVVATIPGSAADPGYAQVHHICGTGPEPGGPVRPQPGMINDGHAGDWGLRHRTEHFLVPVARSVDRRNGMAFGLHCADDGTPSGHLNPVLLEPGAPRRVTLEAGGRTFVLDGYGDRGGTVSFPLDPALGAAMAAGGEVRWIVDGAPMNVFRTGGMEAAMRFALSGCS
ncbi:hypothetical protein [Roseivivax isoporae]|uniref:Uncharacterized protein n=1 Tax=Roseivivax isoporae LMG 25204 TaxID=1449351 RepID=X7FBD6_9RHOB|nr:hypothetical protein [Roseivivax isoporae]ETX30222.1 hypothetical protein RISW2_17995 [Roseivivax isoporae LMG 25204]